LTEQKQGELKREKQTPNCAGLLAGLDPRTLGSRPEPGDPRVYFLKSITPVIMILSLKQLQFYLLKFPGFAIPWVP